MTTPTPRSADTVQEDRARTEGPFTFERIPDPPHTDRKIPRRGDRTDRILGRVLWGLCGAMVTLAVIVVILAMIALLSRPVAVERTNVSAPMLDRALAEGALIRGLKEGNGARLRVEAGDPLPVQVKVSGADACKLAGGTVMLQSDPPSCDVAVPLIGGVR
ncbi:Uncharacterised protein [Mycobacteroides abscessus subsp. abscessus]|uniref:hypothetical protein n=1 Tax=Mycobacteroides abscessus TaxID=36809 RepID=UPI0009A6545C|nr:hypothetical protein [Mycobacteroides abscessus]SKV12283.1 Uncharacterised protein [Mycobacteroides abscessus subsp. abscessus]